MTERARAIPTRRARALLVLSAVLAGGLSLPAARGAPLATLECAAPSIDDRCEAWVTIHRSTGAQPADFGTSAMVDPAGRRMFVAGSTNGSYDALVMALDPSTGEVLWRDVYDGPARGSDGVGAMAVSPDGATVYVAGVTLAESLNLDFLILAYDAATGARRWVTGYDTACLFCGAVGVALSPDGARIYVTGHGNGRPELSDEAQDYVTLALDTSTGARLWEARYDGPRSNLDWPYSVAVSAAGDAVYVGGRSRGAGGAFDYDYATVAYDAITGEERWVARYDGGTLGLDDGYTVAASQDGRIVLAVGESQRPGTRRRDRVFDDVLLAYDADTGTEIWSVRQERPGGQYASVPSLAVAGDRAYVSGARAGTVPNETDLAVAAYDIATGTKAWEGRHGLPAWRDVQGTYGARVVVAGSRVYATGTSYSSTLDREQALTAAYDASTGERLWTARWQSSVAGSHLHSPAAIAAGPGALGAFVVATFAFASVGPETDFDIAVLSYGR